MVERNGIPTDGFLAEVEIGGRHFLKYREGGVLIGFDPPGNAKVVRAFGEVVDSEILQMQAEQILESTPNVDRIAFIKAEYLWMPNVAKEVER